MVLSKGTLPDLPGCLAAAGVVGAWTHDLSTDRVIADLAVSRLFGLAEPDPINGNALQAYSDAIHPDDKDTFNDHIMAASQGGGFVALQYRLATSDSLRWVHDYGSFTTDANGRPARGQGIVIDASLARRPGGLVDELSAKAKPDAFIQAQANDLAHHVIAASEIARVLSSNRLKALTDPLLLEVGRLLGWLLAKRP